MRHDLLEQVVEDLTEAVVVITTDFRIEVINRAARALCGVQGPGNHAFPCCMVLHNRSGPCEDSERICPARLVAKTGQPITVLQEHLGSNGDQRMLEISASPLHDSGGHPNAVLQVFRDVTEKARSAAIAHRAMNEWEATADAVPELLFLTNLEDRVVRCNRSASTFLRKGYAEIIDRTVADLFSASLGRDFTIPDLDRAELRCDRPRLVLELSRYPVPVGSKRYGTVLAFRDVTILRRLEAIASSFDMMNNLGHVLGAVRHEIGNPLNAIKTALTVMQEEVGAIPEDRRRIYVERCLDDVRRVEALLEHLRSFNMFESVKPEAADVLAIVRRSVEMTRPEMQTRRVAMEARLPLLQRLEVLADSRALQHVLLTLVSNALDATERRDSAAITLEVWPEAEEVRVVVADNGEGISEGDLETVFLPLFTTKPKGTGLGLTIARNMITKMNGTIELRSKLGEGTRVEITLQRTLQGRATEKT
jgi:signal transduction histidine kinase